MRAADVMVQDVISIASTASVQDAANLLLTRRAGALPVSDAEGNLVGMVPEGDLMRRPEKDTERRQSWWLKLFAPRKLLAEEFARSHPRKVSDVMTRQVITATPETPLAEITTLLEKNLIKRVPITRDGKVVGIVSRTNLLHGLAAFPKGLAASVADEKLEDLVIARMGAAVGLSVARERGRPYWDRQVSV